jgi:hypothetical protein
MGKRFMQEKALLLERTIERDLKAIEEIYEAIDRTPFGAGEEELIVLAYRLHNLYNAFENIFQNIAVFFENNLDDRARWHSQLLQRMLLDLTPIRPAVIDEETLDKLDELRRFRHVFRSAYTIKLDSERLSLVRNKALALRQAYRPQINRFLTFLKSLQ